MFDISWTEFLLIGIVALVVIGPKELPGVMRTLGQYTRKIRGMAAEFQNQFQEAMREAEMADLKKQVDEMAQGLKDDIKSYDPLKSVREDVETIGKDLDKDFAKKPLELMSGPSTPAPGATETSATETSASAGSTIASSANEATAAAPPLPAPELKPEPAAIATPESTERTG
jgi:sec-independent protein translocase protein TatB